MGTFHKTEIKVKGNRLTDPIDEDDEIYSQNSSIFNDEIYEDNKYILDPRQQ